MSSATPWIAQLAKRISPAVASVFSSRGSGSGFAVRLTSAQARAARGAVIATNAHVIDGDPDELLVRFTNGFDIRPTVLLSDAVEDVAFLRIDASEAPRISLPLRDSSRVQIGEPVVALGNPQGYEFSVSQGIVSGLARSVPSGRPGANWPAPDLIRGDLIQTDALTSHGNSGGPLVDAKGNLIGINSLSFRFNTDNEFGENLHFAIPSNTVRDHLIEALTYGDGAIKRGAIGARVTTVGFSPEEQRRWKRRSGVRIDSMASPRSPAAKAGLQVGDVVIGFRGKPVDHHHDIQLVLDRSSIDSECHVVYIRDGKRRRSAITPSARPERDR